MVVSKILRNIQLKDTPNDVIFTPLSVAKLMIEMCDINKNDKVLDPSYGEGVFYNNLPECDKDYCEITMNKDFFECNNKYDLIIGNPPFSLWTKWLEHTMKLTNKFCYIMGALNLTRKRLSDIENKGYGLTKMHILTISWWFGTSYICIFEKNKQSIITISPEPFLCDICNKSNCKRGRDKKSFNKCTNVI